ncbi:PAS domain S-box protein, partial [Pseudomonadota bacterium]
RKVTKDIVRLELNVSELSSSIVDNKSYISTPIYDSDHKIVGVISVLSRSGAHNLDLAGHMLRLCSSRVSAELERSKAKERLSSIVESMSDFIWETDSHGVIGYCSEKVTPILGFGVDEVVAKSVYDFIDEADVDGGGSGFFDSIRDGGYTRNYELWVDGKNRNKVCLLCNVMPLHDEEGEISGYRGVYSDITHRKESEAQTRLLATAINQSVDGVVIADTLGVVEYVNPAYLNIVGRKEENIIGKNILDSGLVTVESNFKNTFIDSLKLGEKWLGHGANKKQSGEKFEEELILTPIYSEKQELVKIVVGVRDITKEKTLEEQYRRSQKMQAIGTLAGGIAHDFNNILSAILGYADLTLEDLPLGSVGRDNLKQVVMAADRAKSLVQQILAFSRQSAIELQTLSPSTMTKEVIKLLRASLPSMIDIRENINAQDVYVKIDPTQYHQVVMNLVVNAGFAIGDKAGTITVSLDNYYVDDDVEKMSPGHYVRLTVEDTGCGMAPEVKERAFEPFFTTKEVDEGTGMGLAAVHGIVKAQHGYIEVNSDPGRGSRFDVYLPVVEDEGVESVETSEECREGTEHILIVDDEEVQTALMQQMLTRHGYHVTTCTRSKLALDLFKQNPDDFDVVITDQNMPEMTGDIMAMAMLKIRPDLPIIICTGYSQRVGAEEAKAMGIRDYIMKPVTTKDLTRVLAKILDIA